MAQFYGSMKGNRGEATRMGTKGSGMMAHIRGWGVGIRVELTHRNGTDICTVYKTSGSNKTAPDIIIGEFHREPN